MLSQKDEYLQQKSTGFRDVEQHTPSPSSKPSQVIINTFIPLIHTFTWIHFGSERPFFAGTSYKGRPMRSWAWHDFLQKILLWMPEEHDGRWVPAKCARGEERILPGMGAESNSVSTHCCLNLKINSYQVPLGSFGDKYQGTHKCTCTHILYTQYISEYSLFLWFIFPGRFYGIPFPLHSASN